MASLQDFPPLKRLMAPTRGAAARRRRLRKIASALCAGLAVFMLFGSGKNDPPAKADTSRMTNLSGLHVISVTADAGIASAAKPGMYVDLWSARGAPIARHLPIAQAASGGGMLSNGSTTVLVGLSDAQMTAYARSHAPDSGASDAILVTLTPK